MKILLDECRPRRLTALFTKYDVHTVRQMNWLGLSNGKLLAAADVHFQVFITVDKNLVAKLTGLKISVIVLRAQSNKLEDLSPLVPDVLARLPTLSEGEIFTVG